MKIQSIFYVTDEVLKNSNAPTIHVVEICNELKNIRYSIKLFVPSLSNTSQINKKVSVKKIYTLQKFKSLFFHPLLAISLIFEILHKRPSLIYIRYFPLLILPIFISKIFNIPCIIEVNGKLVDETEFSNKYLLAKIYKMLGVANITNVSHIIAVTSGIKDYLIENYKIDTNKVSVINNGVSLKMYKSLSISNARKKTKIPSNYFYVGYVGSLYEYQGLSYIIKTIKKLSSKFPLIRFLIVGNGPHEEKEKLISLINTLNVSKNVTIINSVSHNKVSDYINSFNVCICYPTKFREDSTSPFKLYEYLLFNKPIICSDLKGIKENFKNLLLYAKAEDTTDLAKKILYLYKNKTLRKNLGSTGNEIISKSHSWNSVAKKIDVILTQEITKYEN